MTNSPNIFRDGPHGEEDRFTANWHYLLDCRPDVAQSVVDRIVEKTGLPASKWVGGTDHPFFSREDRPDFAIRTDKWRLVCEHKLESALGETQLERYLKLEKLESADHVALIANNILDLEKSVLEHPRYRRAKGDRAPHLLWEDFYPLIKGSSDRLCRDFATYMEDLGMSPLAAGDWPDPMVDPAGRERFRKVIELALDTLRQGARVAKRDPIGPGFSLQHPAPGISLIWAGFSKRLRKPIRQITEKPFAVNVYKPLAGNALVETGVISSQEGLPWLAVETHEEPLSGVPCFVRTYVIPYSEVLLVDSRRAVEKIVQIVQMVVALETPPSNQL